ncbi:MAG: hypothetical protein EOP04_03290 [Proteobacteria bacterium]|nr:MAG: hypothetical protein EOP04_03290 [Pseudomonadota bacterium]
MDKSTLDEMISKSDDIASLAAECGIDWHSLTDDDFSSSKNKKPPLISDAYKNKSVMWISEKQGDNGARVTVINFVTNKHGGRTRTWVGYERPTIDGTKKKSKPWNKPSPEQERLERKRKFEAFQKAYAEAPRASVSSYLERKGILQILDTFELRELTDHKVFGRGKTDPYVCFPVFDPFDRYVGLQRLYADGAKKLTPGAFDGHYRAAHSIIGNPETAEVMYIAEGFATAASIYLATGCPVVFARDAGNLDAVTRHITSKYDNTEIIIACDNDVSIDGNTGVYKALLAAKNHGIKVVVPPSINGQKTDFNDLHIEFGLDHVRETLLTPANIHKVPKTQLEYLFKILPFAHRHELPKLIKQISLLSKVPHFVTEKELSDKIKALVGTRTSDEVIRKSIRAVVIASGFRAKAISEIKESSVDRRYLFKTERNAAGHLIVGQSAIDQIQKELDEGHCVILKAPMGTGKTELVIKSLLSNVTRGAHVLPRVSVVNDAAQRLGIEHYKNVDSLLVHFTDKMATCINSIGACRFESSGFNWFENLEILCLDEASQALAQLTQLGKASRKKDNHDAFVKAVQSAERFLVADADANEYLVTELKRLDPARKITLVEVFHDAEVKKVWNIHVSESVDTVREEFIKSVAAGNRCLLATDNRRKAMEMERLISLYAPSAKVLNIHREPTSEGRAKATSFYENPNEEIKKYDVMIYSPAITSGVSITHEHFQRHFGIFVGIIKVNDIVQMMGRDRTSKEWLLALAPRSFAKEDCKLLGSLQSLGEEETLYSKLKHSTIQYEKEARENLTILAINILQLKGHRVTMRSDLEAKANKSLKEAIKRVNLDISNERYLRILRQADITEDEFNIISKVWLPDDEQSAALYAYRIRNFLCGNLTIENVDFMDKGGLKKVQLFETFLSEDRDLVRFDNSQKLTRDASDRYFAFEKKRMLSVMVEKLGLDSNLQGEFTSVECQKVLDYFLENSEKANQIFDGLLNPKKPPRCSTTFVRRVLLLMGLSLLGRKSNGKMIRSICQASVDKVTTFANCRWQKGKTYIPQSVAASALAA